MTVLLTGGAGYIGSHVAQTLIDSGESVVIVDNFSTGLRSRISHLPNYLVDLGRADYIETLENVIIRHQITSVIHLAARKQVAQSVEQPEGYFVANIGGLANLLTAMKRTGVNKLVFSSSAATYGNPFPDLITETEATNPVNPYGQTKLVGEWLIKNAEIAWGLQHVSLRYFNVAGAGSKDLADTQKLNLIPIVFAALKDGKDPVVFGGDYPTPDGSCIRDYVHVSDLAEAHLSALRYLDTPDRQHSIFNVGTGLGSSVFEVLEEIRTATGIDFDIDLRPRRAGDPPQLVADVKRIEQVMNWKTKKNLKDIVASAWAATK
jgi:UDP-glucose 4-epimerase